MPTIHLTSTEPRAGRTGVAVAIARHYAYQGRPVVLAREAGDAGAEGDAAFFASLAFLPGSSAAPVDVATLAAPAGTVVVAERAPGSAVSPADGDMVVAVARGAAPKAGAGANATVVTAAPRTVAGAAGRFVIPEDRTLAGFGVDDVARILGAEVLVAGSGRTQTCDHLVVAPISADAGQPYFRRFATKAVVVRYDRSDMHLAALQGDPECLVLTGGRRPSEYLFDAAGSRGVTVLLSRTDTENTVRQLGDIFGSSPFRGERKIERMAALLEAVGLFEALAV